MDESKPTPDLSAMLSGLLANPAALSALTGMLGNFAARPGGPPPQASGSGPCGPPPPMPCPPSQPPCPPPPKKDTEAENRRKLLLALRPFLSPPRQELLEKILRICELMDLFRTPCK